MNQWAWNDIASVMNARWHIEPTSDSVAFVGASIDTRSLEPGQVFFAFEGEQVDGHRFLEAAKKAGASACVVTHPERVPEGIGLPILIVNGPLNAITSLAIAWRQKLACKVIAITGSNGKTTSCRLMHAICDHAGKAYVSPKSFNNALGVPLTILSTPIDTDYLVAEVGMSTPGEIAARTETLLPDIAIITSIGRAHLEALGSIDKIAIEKAQIISASPTHTVGVIPDGIHVLDQAMRDDPHGLVRLGDGFECLESVESTTAFSINGEMFRVPMPGMHNASNAALCVLAARQLRVNDDIIRAGLANATPPEMRLQRIEIETGSLPIVIINDAYNANPDSMRAAIETFVRIEAPARRVAVLGEMLELGDSAQYEHQSLADEVRARTELDEVIFIGALFGSASDEGGIALAVGMIEPGDTVLIKGSRGVRLERLIDKLGEIHGSSRSNEKETARPDA